MATDRYLWKELDMARVASNTEIVDVKQTMFDVHRRYLPGLINDENGAGNGAWTTIGTVNRLSKVVSVKATTAFNIAADNTDYATFNLHIIRAGAIVGTVVRFTTQTQAFGGGPPWGTGSLSALVTFDPVAYTLANPTKPMIFENVNQIQKDDVLAWQIFKGGAGVILAPNLQTLFTLTVDLEEI